MPHDHGNDHANDHGHGHGHARGDAHGHGHGHHHHDTGQMSDRRLVVAVVINLALTVVQVAGGVLSGSLALIADALHNFSDAATLVIAYAARRIARRPADTSMTFGYGRAEIVAALVNYTSLILIGLYLAYESIMRILDPQPVEGWTMVVVAGVALAVDAGTAVLTYAMSRQSMNIRAAFLHNVADALASVAVIVGGVVVLLFDWTLIDPLLTIAISGYVLWHGLSEIGEAIRILMLGTPAELDADAVIDAMRAAPGVDDVHHVHIWRFDERRVSLEAHVVVAGEADAVAVKAGLRRVLAEQFSVGHVTLEVEAPGEACQASGGVPA